MTSGRKVLVVGSGGREHALGVRLLASPSVAEVIVVPGNAGTARTPVRLAPKSLRNAQGDPLAVARSERPDLVVIGPEAPLCGGIVDALGDDGSVAFGPTRSAAQLEGSKVFMKEFAERHGILTARYRVLDDAREVDDAVRSFDRPPVVKADGLCAGKGVVVADNHEQAARAARSMLSGEQFGAAGRRVVVEERVAGAEASVHAISDGERVVMLPAAQDHKRLGDSDTGPNTGGMGSYAPAPLVTPALAERIRHEVVERAIQGMAHDGAPYRGALFAGLMITPDGEPYLLEFNVRFGDPETQVLMHVIDGDFAEALDGAARGRLAPQAMAVSERHALCVVLAAAGYPNAPRKGDPISGLERAGDVEGARVYHAGTRLRAGLVVTDGGRVLGVTAEGRSLAEAHARAYRAAECIEFAGRQMRRDIGARALGGVSV